MKLTNYHTHSRYCDGTGEPEDYVREAVRRGFDSLGFTGHSPLPFPNDWTMDDESLSEYMNAIRQLRHRYRGRIEILLGLETDYLDESFFPGMGKIQSLGLDYQIGSVHMLQDQEDGAYYSIDGPLEELQHLIEKTFGGSTKSMLGEYFAQLRKMVVAGGFDILGHLDLPKKHNRSLGFFSEQEPWYRALIRETLRFCAATIGSKTDPRSGEEPGRVLHEYPPHERDGLSTQYNACETSHLFLIAAEGLLTADRGEEVLGSIRPALQAAGAYLLRHLEGDLFWEDPRHAGARRYLLPATYWKDSFLPGRRELRFPVAYTLVQAQTVAALRALAALTEALDLGFDPRALTAQARAMIEVVWNVLWDEEAGYPALALDDGQLVRGVSSDGLHLLAYLRPDDVPAGRREELARRAQELVTPYGFRTLSPCHPDYSPTGYHQGSIWPYEQWFIARGAQVHGLAEVFEVAARVGQALAELGFVELLYWDEERGLRGPGEVPGEGCDRQLWSAAVPEGFVRLEVGGEGGRR